jgi:hypothetical protein
MGRVLGAQHTCHHEDLTRLWLGHSKESVTDYYAGGLKNDSAWQQEWSERVGLGFR